MSSVTANEEPFGSGIVKLNDMMCVAHGVGEIAHSIEEEGPQGIK
jgi:hypothetical protein